MKDTPEIRGSRSRDEGGPPRRKREDPQVGTIDGKCRRGFGLRSDLQLIDSDIGRN